MSDYYIDADEEDGNYDDFMMTDEEALEGVEMADDINEIYTDNKDPRLDDFGFYNNINNTDNDVYQEESPMKAMPPLQSIQDIYDKALHIKENDDLDLAVTIFESIAFSENITKNDTSIVLRSFEQLINIIALKYKINSTIPSINSLIDEIQKLFIFISNNFNYLKKSYVEDTLSHILSDMTPNLYKGYLFDAGFSESSSVLEEFKFQKEFINQFHILVHNFKDIIETERLETIIYLKKFTIDITIEFLSNGCIDIKNCSNNYSFIDMSALKKETDVLFAFNTYYQYFIYEFIQTGTIVEVNQFKNYLDIFERIQANSFSAIQNSETMILFYFGKTLSRIIFDLYSDSNSDAELISFFENINRCKREFRICLKILEELGGKYNDYQNPFQWLIISGYVFSNMILYHSNEETLINPFEIEQLKAERDSNIVIGLQLVYNNYIDLNLTELASNMEKLSPLRSHWDKLVNKIYYLGIVTKLWTQIAPVYDCISIKDLRKMLRLHQDSMPSHDELLEILMKSITKNDKSVYFKLDLINDLVYFGVEYNIPITNYPASKFNSNKSIRSLICNNIELAIDIECNFNDNNNDTNPITTKSDFFHRLRKSTTNHTGNFDGRNNIQKEDYKNNRNRSTPNNNNTQGSVTRSHHFLDELIDTTRTRVSRVRD
ncbi:hypothetical protein TPHA_0A00500 [Tetrapisispora phaffii CBS 4417]|uniref:PCI domain-containing protein n=1 Tax=Tetrapisispora phaffii (strain ATCC 24235 / CBS 4417 / NBRC 1672 / NRRL Y-8282 / UCD 70-5) TaxID=1071381 RepID=G8BMK7_TETPH|nr:hypothetical protein TPHA_0A00500 [Tetrapisispora phaffii CBS 4417]CCE61135.1 hypothetical protein TPHA_0A00500 [Tetrapisispora phaffii CBS 4417]